MGSRPTDTPPDKAIQPRQRRGYARVAAILDAAVQIFEEKGFDLATMTEIAERSDTAIASLYRFFPSKDAVAEALLTQYALYASHALSQIRERAKSMSLDDLAAALVEFRLAIHSHGRSAVGLSEARYGNDEKRNQFRKIMFDGIADALREVIPLLPKRKANLVAALIVHTLRAVKTLDQEASDARGEALDEIRNLLRAYLRSVAGSPSSPAGTDD